MWLRLLCVTSLLGSSNGWSAVSPQLQEHSCQLNGDCHPRAYCDSGRRVCRCTHKYVGDGKTCFTDACSNKTCGANADCMSFMSYHSEQLRLSQRCVCHAQHFGDADVGCVLGACAPGHNDCHAAAICVMDTVGDEHKCFCKTGYVGDGRQCHKDECESAEEGPLCTAPGQTCIQVGGRSTCVCDSELGYWPQPDGSCLQDPCLSGAHSCPVNSLCSSSRSGDYTCMCQLHHYPHDNQCLLHACMSRAHNCSVHASCIEQYSAGKQLLPGFTCQCIAGYYGDGHTCQPDACEQGTHNCPSADACLSDGLGGYSCDCPPLHYSVNGSCVEHVCAASEGAALCSAHADCVATGARDYDCVCRHPYIADAQGGCVFDAALASCDPGYYACAGAAGRCIPGTWVMDGHVDCPDGSDENAALVDMCKVLGDDKCDPSASCSSHANGTFSCHCPPGTSGNGFVCQPADLTDNSILSKTVPVAQNDGGEVDEADLISAAPFDPDRQNIMPSVDQQSSATVNDVYSLITTAADIASADAVTPVNATPQPLSSATSHASSDRTLSAAITTQTDAAETLGVLKPDGSLAYEDDSLLPVDSATVGQLDTATSGAEKQKATVVNQNVTACLDALHSWAWQRSTVDTQRATCKCGRQQIYDQRLGACKTAQLARVALRVTHECQQPLQYNQLLADPGSRLFQSYAAAFSRELIERMHDSDDQAVFGELCVLTVPMQAGSAVFQLNMQCLNTTLCTADRLSALLTQNVNNDITFDSQYIQVVDQCASGGHTCHANASCTATGLTYSCQCNNGHIDTRPADLPGRFCQPLPPSAAATQSNTLFSNDQTTVPLLFDDPATTQASAKVTTTEETTSAAVVKADFGLLGACVLTVWDVCVPVWALLLAVAVPALLICLCCCCYKKHQQQQQQHDDTDSLEQLGQPEDQQVREAWSAQPRRDSRDAPSGKSVLSAIKNTTHHIDAEVGDAFGRRYADTPTIWETYRRYAARRFTSGSVTSKRTTVVRPSGQQQPQQRSSATGSRIPRRQPTNPSIGVSGVSGVSSRAPSAAGGNAVRSSKRTTGSSGEQPDSYEQWKQTMSAVAPVQCDDRPSDDDPDCLKDSWSSTMHPNRPHHSPV